MRLHFGKFKKTQIVTLISYYIDWNNPVINKAQNSHRLELKCSLSLSTVIGLASKWTEYEVQVTITGKQKKTIGISSSSTKVCSQLPKQTYQMSSEKILFNGEKDWAIWPLGQDLCLKLRQNLNANNVPSSTQDSDYIILWVVFTIRCTGRLQKIDGIARQDKPELFTSNQWLECCNFNGATISKAHHAYIQLLEKPYKAPTFIILKICGT